MPIILSQSYEIVTEESAANGDVQERGFDFENVAHTFRETVELIQSEGFTVRSDTFPGAPRWLSTEVIQDRAFFEDGENKTLSLHPGNDPRSLRYWEKACRASGLIKDDIYWRGLIKDAHHRGLRAEVTYRDKHGYTAKGLAVNDASKGVGPNGVWFVPVNNFVNTVRLSDIISVRQVER